MTILVRSSHFLVQSTIMESTGGKREVVEHGKAQAAS